MGLFDTIASKIFGVGHPAGAPDVRAAPTAAASSVLKDGPQAAAAGIPSSPRDEVDVSKLLDELEAQSSRGLDWRHSIVDLMTLLGLESSFSARSALAKELAYDGGTSDVAAMNVWLHGKVMSEIRDRGNGSEEIGGAVRSYVRAGLADQTAEDEIVERVQVWAGSKQKARDWYRNFEIPSLGNKTAEVLANDGRLPALRKYLDRISDGGFA